MFRVFLQARMNSQRFPGKVLAPLCGKPVIRHVLDRITEAMPPAAVVIATSTALSDDPLAAYAKSIGANVFRGDLENVVSRFQQCLKRFPCDFFFRICADSPLLDPDLVRAVAKRCVQGVDLVTNVQERTFPAGQSVECLAAERFAALDTQTLDADEREHVTLHYYRKPAQFRIVNLRANTSEFVGQRLVVDTIEDLRRLEAIVAASKVPKFSAHILQEHAA